MSLKDYYKRNKALGKAHVENVLKYGPQLPFGYPEMLVEQKERIDFIVSHAEKPVLDIGSDSGYILDMCGGGVGVDLFLDRVKACRYWHPTFDVLNAAAENLPFREGVFQTIVLAEILEHVLNPETVLEEAFRVLKKHGKLLVTVPDEISGKSHMNPEHLRKYSEGSLRNLLLQYYDLETVEYVYGDYPAWCVCCRKTEETF